MLVLTKLDNAKILVSLSSIKYFESVPDTILFFLNGESVIVRETFAEIMAAVDDFRERPMSLAGG